MKFSVKIYLLEKISFHLSLYIDKKLYVSMQLFIIMRYNAIYLFIKKTTDCFQPAADNPVIYSR